MAQIAKFPEQKLPPICTLSPDYMKIFIGRDGWRDAAECLLDDPELPPGMQNFCYTISRMKKRPSVKQLGLLLSLHVNLASQEVNASMIEAETKAQRTTARVIKLKPDR